MCVCVRTHVLVCILKKNAKHEGVSVPALLRELEVGLKEDLPETEAEEVKYLAPNVVTENVVSTSNGVTPTSPTAVWTWQKCDTITRILQTLVLSLPG